MEFENKGMGRCVILKEGKNNHALVYSISYEQFINISDLDRETGEWLHGKYFDNLDDALHELNQIGKEDEYEK